MDALGSALLTNHIITSRVAMPGAVMRSLEPSSVAAATMGR